MQGDIIPPPLDSNTVVQIWPNQFRPHRMNSISLPCSLMAQNVYESHKSIRHIMETTCSGSRRRSTRNIVVARLVSGRLAFVPRWTEPGDLVAGLELPGSLVFSHDVLSRAFEVIRPITHRRITLKSHSLERNCAGNLHLLFIVS